MSPDGGVTWDDMATLTDPQYPLVAHGDYHALAFDPENPKIIYVGNDGGLDRSTDMSKAEWHWTDVSHGMVITDVLVPDVEPRLSDAARRRDAGQRHGLTFGNRTWYQPGGCDGYDVGSDAENPETLYANCNHNLATRSPIRFNGTHRVPVHILWSTIPSRSLR